MATKKPGQSLTILLSALVRAGELRRRKKPVQSLTILLGALVGAGELRRDEREVNECPGEGMRRRRR